MFNLVLELDSHLIYLSTLHVFMVDLISFNYRLATHVLIKFNKVIKYLMSLTKFIYDKFLHGNYVYHIKLRLD